MKADHPTIMANYRPWQHQGLAGLTITQEAPFKWRARTETCDAIVIHESAGTNPAKTLRRKSLGCHFIIGPGGHVMQHNDISARVSHASKMNDRSIGIEVINPYYPPPTQSWIDVIDNAPWAHKKRYLVPTLKQLEATAQLVGVLTSASLDGVEIPRFFTGLATHGSSGGVSTAMAMGMHRAGWEREGIAAHCYEGRHADGAFPALYCYLRIAVGLSAAEARRQAMQLALERVAKVPA